MINPQRLELPMSRMNFYDPKDVRAIEVRLYSTVTYCKRITRRSIAIDKVIYSSKSYILRRSAHWVCMFVTNVRKIILLFYLLEGLLLKERICSLLYITKTCLFNFDPLKPHFHIVNLGFTRVYISFLIFAKKHKLWVLVRTASPRRL